MSDLHEIRARIEARQQRAREAAPTWGKSVRVGGVDITFTHQPQVGRWEAAEATKVFVYHENPTVVLRNCDEDYRALNLHGGEECDDHPHGHSHMVCVQCDGDWPCEGISSLARRYGVEEVDGG